MTVVVTFQKFAHWLGDVAVYPRNSENEFPEKIVEIIPVPLIDEDGEVDLEKIDAFDKCPRDHAMFVYHTEISADEINEDTFAECLGEMELIYSTPLTYDKPNRNEREGFMHVVALNYLMLYDMKLSDFENYVLKVTGWKQLNEKEREIIANIKNYLN